MKKITLTKGRVALVDDEDYGFLMQWKWCCDSKGYAMRTTKRSETKTQARTVVFMHRAILKAEKGTQVDHKSGDTLDNRKSNLRVATHSDNMRNRKLQKNNKTGFKGVWFNSRRQKFVATIKINGSSRTLKHTDTAEEAAHIYNQFAEQLFGEFARLNKI